MEEVKKLTGKEEDINLLNLKEHLQLDCIFINPSNLIIFLLCTPCIFSYSTQVKYAAQLWTFLLSVLLSSFTQFLCHKFYQI